MAFENTYFKNPGDPGTFSTDRYEFNWILMSISVAILVLIPMAIFFMLIFRQNYGCNVVWFTVYILFFLGLIFIIAAFGIQYSSCNAANSPDNMCNDYRWCCVNYINPLNRCPNVTPCSGVTEPDLVPNEEFLGVFWTIVSLAFMHLLFLIVLIIYWVSPSEAPQNDDNEVQTFTPLENPITVSMKKMHSHGLAKNPRLRLIKKI
ncbi:hypothetical protein OAB94_02410 [Flavobacteriaceae bacterium]|nr:hypothetical protein [Flavobacteriaceae bacterium]